MSRKERLSGDEFRATQEKCNRTIASALAGILRMSLESEFRSKCFTLMKVDNTNDFETSVKKELDKLSLLINKEQNPEQMTSTPPHEVHSTNISLAAADELEWEISNAKSRRKEDQIDFKNELPQGIEEPLEQNRGAEAEDIVHADAIWH